MENETQSKNEAQLQAHRQMMKNAVLKECERLCPEFGSVITLYFGNVRQCFHGYPTFIHDAFGMSISFDRRVTENWAHWEVLYTLLKLDRKQEDRLNQFQFVVGETGITKTADDILIQYAESNNDLGWATDGRHSFQSVYEQGLINGARFALENLPAMVKEALNR